MNDELRRRKRIRQRQGYRYGRSLGLSAVEATMLKGRTNAHILGMAVSGITPAITEACVRKKAADEAHRRRNPHQDIAKGMLNNAIHYGRIVRLPCGVCGSVRSQGHHDDYDKPFDVTWLCSQHHADVHREVAPWSDDG